MLLTSFFPTDLLRGIYEVFFHVAFLFFHLLSLIVDVCIFIGVGYKARKGFTKWVESNCFPIHNTAHSKCTAGIFHDPVIDQ